MEAERLGLVGELQDTKSVGKTGNKSPLNLRFVKEGSILVMINYTKYYNFLDIIFPNMVRKMQFQKCSGRFETVNHPSCRGGQFS